MLEEGVDGEDEIEAPDVGKKVDEDVVGVDEADLDVDVVDMEGGALNNSGGGDDNDNREEDVITGFEVIVGTTVVGGLCSAVVCAVVIGIVWMVAIVPCLQMT